MIEKLILVDIGPLSSLPRIEFLTENFFHLLDSCLKDLPPNINLSDARIQVKKILNEKIKVSLVLRFKRQFFLPKSIPEHFDCRFSRPKSLSKSK